MPVIQVNRVVDKNRIIRKKWRTEEEESHKGMVTPQKFKICPKSRFKPVSPK
jgi:hypothetical protein